MGDERQFYDVTAYDVLRNERRVLETFRFWVDARNFVLALEKDFGVYFEDVRSEARSVVTKKGGDKEIIAEYRERYLDACDECGYHYWECICNCDECGYNANWCACEEDW